MSAALGIEENIGIATFGEQTGVFQHMTNDYDKVREALGNWMTKLLTYIHSQINFCVF